MRRPWARFAAYSSGVIRRAHCVTARRGWRVADKVLRSRRASALVMILPTAAAVAIVISREGIYGLVSNAENLTAIGALPCLAIRAGRRYRQIQPLAARTSTAQSGLYATPRHAAPRHARARTRGDTRVLAAPRHSKAEISDESRRHSMVDHEDASVASENDARHTQDE